MGTRQTSTWCTPRAPPFSIRVLALAPISSVLDTPWRSVVRVRSCSSPRLCGTRGACRLRTLCDNKTVRIERLKRIINFAHAHGINIGKLELAHAGRETSA